MNENINVQNFDAQESYQQKKQTKQENLTRLRRRRYFKSTAIWLVVLLGLAGAVWGMAKLASQKTQPSLLTDTISPEDWTKGNLQAKVVLVEYSDFECPACGAYYPLLKQLDEELGGQMLFVYRHFPLGQHQAAPAAAWAAEAAGRQGKFWEMHDLIFENQRQWASLKASEAEEIFLSLAQKLDLDLDQFKTDRMLEEIKNKVSGHYQSGQRSGVTATPNFFLNGEKILRNPQSYESFKELLEKAIQTAAQS